MAKAMTVAEFLDAAIDISGKSQKEIAAEAGYAKPNFISMMKTGVTKVPVDKVPALARACGVDERQFLRLAMNEYMPETWAVIQDSLGANLVTEEERKLLEAFRSVKDSIPPDAYSGAEPDVKTILKAIAEREDE